LNRTIETADLFRLPLQTAIGASKGQQQLGPKKGFGAKKTSDEEKPSQTFQRFNIGGFALGCTGRLPHATKKKKKRRKKALYEKRSHTFSLLACFSYLQLARANPSWNCLLS
jgi:hypothetical protein